MLWGTNLEQARAYNLRVVLEVIRLYGPISRAEIARRTGLTLQTVSNLVRALDAAGLLLYRGRAAASRGQPPVEIDIRPEAAFSIGLNLDRDHLTGVLVDLKGHRHGRVHRELTQPLLPEPALAQMAELVEELLAQVPEARDRLWGIGVAIPGPIDLERKRVRALYNFPGWDDVAVRDPLQRRLGIPVYVENDATAAAIGEKWFGAGRDLQDFFYVYLGICVGGGIVLGGQPYYGSTGNAGEFGHVPVGPGDPTTFGARVSMGALYQAVGASTPAELVERFRMGDPALQRWLDQAAEWLIPPLIAVESLLDPEAILFGGRLPEPLLQDLIQRLAARLPRYRMPGKPRYPQLLLGQAREDAPALGAAILPIFQVLFPSTKRLLKKRRKPEPLPTPLGRGSEVLNLNL